ncbi:tyrosine-type recombinase/integrase [Pirellulaceae bacterium SH501]
MSQEISLQELLSAYIKKRLKAGSPNTLRLYKHSITSFEKTLEKVAQLNDLTDDNIERHMWAIVGRGGSPASANKDFGQLTALWRFASHNRMIDTWPNVRPLPEPERVPLGWIQEELDRLFTTIAQQKGVIWTVPASIWWRSLLLVLLDTGERIGAVRQLERHHLQGEYLLIPAHIRKGKKRDKLFHLNEDTVQSLTEMNAKHDSDLLFPWDRCDNYIYKRYDAILKAAKLSHDRRSKFHRVRRTVASAVANQGGDPTAAMDHASPRTTRKYLDPRIVGGLPTSNLVAKWRTAK